jgi:hypothetical protein
LGNRVEELNHQAKQAPGQVIPVLEELISQYPRFPILQNYLVVAYTLTGRKEEAGHLAREMYLHFPDYLYARTTYGRMLLEQGDLQGVAEVLENKFDVKQLFPERDVFHFSEVIQYAGLVAEYFIERGDSVTAQPYVTLMEDIDINYPLTRHVVLKMMSSRIGKGVDLGKFLGRP